MIASRRVLLVLAVCSLASLALGCKPGPGWVPKTVPQLVPGAPVVAVVQVTRITGDVNIQNVTATIQCVLKHGSMNRVQQQRLLGRTVRIQGYGSGSLCKNSATRGSRDLVFMIADSNGDYTLFYDGIGSAARAATTADVAAARGALTRRQRAAAVCRSGFVPVAAAGH